MVKSFLVIFLTYWWSWVLFRSFSSSKPSSFPACFIKRLLLSITIRLFHMKSKHKLTYWANETKQNNTNQEERNIHTEVLIKKASQPSSLESHKKLCWKRKKNNKQKHTHVYTFIHSAILYIMYTYLGEKIKTTTNNRK